MFHVKQIRDWLIHPIIRKRLDEKIKTIEESEQMMITAGGHSTDRGMYLIGVLQHHYDERDALMRRLSRRKGRKYDHHRRRYVRP